MRKAPASLNFKIMKVMCIYAIFSDSPKIYRNFTINKIHFLYNDPFRIAF